MDEIIESRELSVEEYLMTFDPDSVDYDLVKKRSDRLEKVVVKKVKAENGRLFEDSTFIEKTGIQYTVRTVFE